MKKVLLILLLAAAFTGLSMPHVAFAGEPGESGAAGGLSTVAPEAAAAQQAAETTYSANQAAAGNRVIEAIGEGFKWLLGLSLKLFLQIFVWIFEILIGIATAVLVVLGTLFNFVVNQMVVEMGKYVTSSTAEGVRVAWGIVRDLANVAIIGSLVAIAIGTILHLQNVNAKNVLAKLLIAALLVNFSYFFAGAVIDSSNFLATKIYESVISADKQCVANRSCNLASTFMELVQIQGLRDDQTRVSNSLFSASSWDGSNANKEMLSNGTIWNQLLYNIMLLIFELVTIFIFLSAITLLVGRFVALILVLITSPIGIVAFMLPATTKYAKEWWEALFTQAFFAPIYFLLVGFSFTIIRSSKDAIFNATASGEVVIGLIITFIVAAVFMLQSLKIAKQMSEKASQFADVYKASGVMTGWMPKAYTNLLARGGIESVGRASDFALERYNRFMARDPKTLGVLGKIGQLALRPGDKYVKDSLGAISKSKMGGDESFLDARQRRIGRRGELDLTGEREKAKQDLQKALPEAEKMRKAYDDLVKAGGDPDKDPKTSKAYQNFIKARAQVEKAFSNLPPEGYENIKLRQPEMFERLSFFLGSAEFNRLVSDKDLPKKIRDNMKNERFRPALELYKQSEDLLRDKVTGKRRAFADLDVAEKDKYKKLQSNMFNVFKRQSISKEDFEPLISYKPELIESEFVMDGGLPHWAKMKTQSTGVLGTAQQRLTKEVWRTGVKLAIKNSARPGLDTDVVFPGRTFETVDINSPEFEAAVKELEQFFPGKQPEEVAKQVSDSTIVSPAFAAAATLGGIKELPNNKDPVYVQSMVDNMVQLHNARWGDPERQARINGILHWMKTNTSGQSLYGDTLTAAISKYGMNPDGAPPTPIKPSSSSGGSGPTAPSSPPSGETTPTEEFDDSSDISSFSEPVVEAEEYGGQGSDETGGTGTTSILDEVPSVQTPQGLGDEVSFEKPQPEPEIPPSTQIQKILESGQSLGGFRPELASAVERISVEDFDTLMTSVTTFSDPKRLWSSAMVRVLDVPKLERIAQRFRGDDRFGDFIKSIRANRNNMKNNVVKEWADKVVKEFGDKK